MVDIVVIGGGAAGCIAAIKAAEAGASVTLIEKNAKIGRKIMITGKGHCNITNAKKWSDFSVHVHNKPSFFKPAFYNFSNDDTIDFFESHGVETVLTRDQRIYPKSMSAASVVDALAGAIEKAGVQVLFNCDVANVTFDEEKGCFETDYVETINLRVAAGRVQSAAVIVATGGLSYPSTGSTGAGYDIARRFGHTVQRTFPSLTALVPAGYDMRLRDITLVNTTVQLFVGHDMVACEFGDIQFTDGGLEGPVGFKISRKAVWALINGNKVSVSIDLKPAVPLQLLKERVAREAEEFGINAVNFNKKIRAFLRKFMPQALIDPYVESNALTLGNLAAKMKDWRMAIVDYVGWRRAVVTAGGVNLEEVVARSMASRNRPGLFFAGEVLDIDCDTGGYNLQFAFSTGALAAKGAVEFVNKAKES